MTEVTRQQQLEVYHVPRRKKKESPLLQNTPGEHSSALTITAYSGAGFRD